MMTFWYVVVLLALFIAVAVFEAERHDKENRKLYETRDDLDEEALVFLKEQLLEMGYTPNAGVPMEKDFYTQNAYLAGIRWGRNNP